MRFQLLRQCAFNSCANGLTIVHPNAGGIDVGNESHFVAVPPDRDPKNALSNSCAVGADGGVVEVRVNLPFHKIHLTSKV